MFGFLGQAARAVGGLGKKIGQGFEKIQKLKRPGGDADGDAEPPGMFGAGAMGAMRGAGQGGAGGALGGLLGGVIGNKLGGFLRRPEDDE